MFIEQRIDAPFINACELKKIKLQGHYLHFWFDPIVKINLNLLTLIKKSCCTGWDGSLVTMSASYDIIILSRSVLNWPNDRWQLKTFDCVSNNTPVCAN
jgi:hypothetical protein